MKKHCFLLITLLSLSFHGLATVLVTEDQKQQIVANVENILGVDDASERLDSFEVFNALGNTRYPLSFTGVQVLHFLRALSSYSDFTLGGEQFFKMAQIIESNVDQAFLPQVREIVSQIEYVQVKKSGKGFKIKIFNKDKKDIMVELNQKYTESVVLRHFKIEHKATIKLEDVKDEEYGDLIKYVQGGQLLGGIVKSFGGLDPIDEKLQQKIEEYADLNKGQAPLHYEVDGLYFHLENSVKNLNFHLKEGYTLPFISQVDENLPSLLIKIGFGGIFGVRTSPPF